MENNCTNCKGTGVVEVCHCFMYDCHEFNAIDYCTTKTVDKCPKCKDRSIEMTQIESFFKTPIDQLKLLPGMSIYDFYSMCIRDSSTWPILADALEEINGDTRDINKCRHLAKYSPKLHTFYLDILTNTIDSRGRIVTSTGVMDRSHSTTIIQKTLSLNNDTKIICPVHVINNKLHSILHEIEYIVPSTFSTPENRSFTVIELTQKIPLQIGVEGYTNNLLDTVHIFHYLLYPLLTNPIIYNNNCILCKGSLDRMSCIECYMHQQRYISRLESGRQEAERRRAEFYHGNEDGMADEELT